MVASHLNINVQKTPFSHFKHKTHFGSGVDPLVEALFCMGVYANEIPRRSGRQDGQKHNELRQSEHFWTLYGRVKSIYNDILLSCHKNNPGPMLYWAQGHRFWTYLASLWLQESSLTSDSAASALMLCDCHVLYGFTRQAERDKSTKGFTAHRVKNVNNSSVK